MSNAKQKAESTGVFFSPPFSCSASLCEQLLAGGSGETPAYTLLEYCRITNSFYSVGFWVSNITIGRLPYYYFPSTCSSADRPSIRLEYCRITTSFLRCQCGHNRGRDWKTAVLILPSTRRGSARHSPRLEDCLGDAGECKTCELERTLDKDYAKPTQLVTVNDAIRFLKHYRLTQGGNARLSDCLADNIDR